MNKHTAPTRYQDLWDWQKATYISVTCPKCQKEAIVYYGRYYWRYDDDSIEVRCHHCNFSKKFESIIYYQIEVSLNCPNCGNKMAYFQDNLKQVPSLVKIKCEHCHHQLETVPKYQPYHKKLTKPNRLKCDDVFGLPLYYQTNVKGNLFWACNQAHAQEILAFVSADLRERAGVGVKMTMTAKLPTFIKSAKNKEMIVKILQKWTNDNH